MFVHKIAFVATIDSGKNNSSGGCQGNYYYRSLTMALLIASVVSIQNSICMLRISAILVFSIKTGRFARSYFLLSCIFLFIVIFVDSFLPFRVDHHFLSVINISLALALSPYVRQYFVIVTSIYFQDSVFLVLLSEY